MKKSGRKIIILVGAVAVAAALCFLVRKLYLRIRYPYHCELAAELSITPARLTEYAGLRNDMVERHFGMLVESARGNWTRLAELTSAGDNSLFGCYFYNLANAMTGHLGDRLLDHAQRSGSGLFIPVDENVLFLNLMASGEVWYQLGEMTMAEHNTILALIYSPEHSGPRFFRRMAEINLINADQGAADKYIRMLGDTPGGSWREKVRFAQRGDTVHLSQDVRPVLRGLVESNPENTAAYEYLLCWDLLHKDIPHFIEDYVPGRKDSRLYQEGALVYLAAHNDVSPEKMQALGITDGVYQRFVRYFDCFTASGGDAGSLYGGFGRTYWFYYHFNNLNEDAYTKKR